MKSPTEMRRLSDRRFAALGLPGLVYIRTIKDETGDKHYSIHAADGEPLVIKDSLESAVMTARLNDFEPVTVH